MDRATIENGGVTFRKVGHAGHPTYDVWHTHFDGYEFRGVAHRSSLHVYLQEPDQANGKPWGTVRVALWVPGGFFPGAGDQVPDGTLVELKWGEEIWTPVRQWGNPSVVSYSDAPLKVLWESVPGIA